MNYNAIQKISTGLLAATLIAACGGASEPESTLPVEYTAVEIADIGTAEALSGRCIAEEASFRNRLALLEAFEGTPTIADYYQSLDSLLSSIGTVASYASSLAGIHPDEALRTAGDECAVLLTKLGTDISLSRPLYDAVAKIDSNDADDTTKHSVEKLLLSFRLAGVDKDDATRQRIRELSDELTVIGQDFDNNIRGDTRYLELDSVDDLAGLPEDYVASHQPNEDGKILISTQYPDVFPFFEYAERDDLRKEMSLIYSNRAYPQNEEALRKLVTGRYELAQLAGFDNYAELVTADKMSGSPARVAEFLDDLSGYTAETQDAEYDVLLARLREEDPDAERLESWQLSYIRSKVRREQYDVDTKLVREFFNYDASRDGILALVQDLFDVRIEPWETETWHEDVEAYELFDGDVAIGRFYLDMHPRDGKFQHAAMFPFVNGIEGQQLPVAGLVCNFPSGSGPMQHSQVVTFLHEFGHLIHWMFAGHQDWSNVSGISTEWDFVEAPSQMLQEWVWDYDTISAFAVNAEGEVLPRDMHERMVAARDFGLGMGTRRQLSFAGTSLNLYDNDPASIEFDQLFADMATKYTRFEPIEDSHGWAAFGHLNGYSAIYYTYQWSLAIGTDMFTRFKEDGLRNVEVANEYKDKVLAAGGSRPAEELVTDFLGRPISFQTYADRLQGIDKPQND
jgi:thimet oligopeptidase